MRRADWPARLNAFVEAARERSFVWGVWDCALAAAEWVEVATGIDHAAHLRDTYADALGAARTLAQHGGLEAIATAALGEPIASQMAQRGDLVLVVIEGRESLCVCVGAAAAGPGPEGLAFPGMDLARLAWRV